MLLRERLLDFVREYPALFFRVIGLKEKYNDIVVTPHTDIVIEGYPRSANTFAVAAFELAQQKAIKIARHTHTVAQIKRSVLLEKPILVLLREPEEAAISYVIREDNVSISLALKRYIQFYSAVKKLRNSLVIADFDEVTTDFGSVIETVNVKFGTHFRKFVHDDESINAVFLRTEQMEIESAGGPLSENKVGRPSASRKSEKKRLYELLNTRGNQKLLAQSIALYNELQPTHRSKISD